MKVLLRNPSRELDVKGPISVIKLLKRLELNRESVLVIRDATLVPGDAQLSDDDVIEIRPVISGGQVDHQLTGSSRSGLAAAAGSTGGVR